MSSSKPALKILLTGKTGQVGMELEPLLADLGQVTACGRQECDLSEPDRIREVVRAVKPNLIVNAAAYTAVDKAEEEAELARAVNAVAPAVLAEEARALNAPLVHYSTEYVYDGTKPAPYREDDPVHPLSVYGSTKAEGDGAIRAAGVPHLIFRTTWVYGLRGKNFLRTIQRLAREREELRIVDDQVGAPTWCRTIAKTTVNVLSQLLENADPDRFQAASGIYNLTCAGKTSWYGFACKIVEAMNLERPPRLVPISSSEYPTPARRPRNSLLSNGKLKQAFGIVHPEWESVLQFCLNSPGA